MTSGKNIAQRMWDGAFAESELESLLYDAGVRFDRMGHDDYDSSLELYDVPAEDRLSDEAQRIIHDAGFGKVYVNHEDKWETHYSWAYDKPFEPVPGWRVSYPHKRGECGGSILVEKHIPSWPKEWFDTGHVVIKGDQP